MNSALKENMATEIEESSLPSKKEEGFLGLGKWFGRSFSKNVGDEIQTLIEEREESGEALSADERELIAAVLKFSDIDADTACVPRSDIVAVQRNASFEEVLDVFQKSELSRLPVYGRDMDEIVGFITLKDIVRYFGRSEEFELRKALRACCFVPDSLPIPFVLAEMRKRKVQLAVVVDEYGGTAGVITGKDIMEELIGDIEDENEREDKSKIQYLSKGRFRIDPRTEIDELSDEQKKQLGVTEDDDYDTVAGLVLQLLGRMPEKGERVALETGHALIVNVVDGRRIRQMTFVPEDDATQEDATSVL